MNYLQVVQVFNRIPNWSVFGRRQQWALLPAPTARAGDRYSQQGDEGLVACQGSEHISPRFKSGGQAPLQMPKR
jgi:hypothetical protein